MEQLLNQATAQLAAQYVAGSGQIVVTLASYGTGFGQFPDSLSNGDFFRVQIANLVLKVTAVNTSTGQWSVTAVGGREGTDSNLSAGTRVVAVESAATLQNMHQLNQPELTDSDIAPGAGIAQSKLMLDADPGAHHARHEPGGGDALDLTKIFPSGLSLPALPNTSYPNNCPYVRTSDNSLWVNLLGTWTLIGSTSGYTLPDAATSTPGGVETDHPATGSHPVALILNSQGVAYVASLPAGSVDIDPTLVEGDLLYHHVLTSAVVGFIGDSITANTPSGGNPPPTNAVGDLTSGTLTVTANNQAIGGTTSSDWTPTASTGYYTAAKAAFLAAGVTVCHIMLGTNDAKNTVATTQAGFKANLAAICADLSAFGILCVLSYSPYAAPGSFSGAIDSTSLTLLQSYQTAIDQLVNGTSIRQGDVNAYTYFQAHTSELADGVHPTATGSLDLAQFWANALKPIVTAPLARLPNGATGTVLQSNGTDPVYAFVNLSSLAQSGAAVGQVPTWNGSAYVPATLNTSGGSGSDHLHGLARWVADGSTTTFTPPDIPEYMEAVYDNGSAVDEATISLSSDLTQLIFASAPAAGHVLQALYVIGSI